MSDTLIRIVREAIEDRQKRTGLRAVVLDSAFVALMEPELRDRYPATSPVAFGSVEMSAIFGADVLVMTPTHTMGIYTGAKKI